VLEYLGLNAGRVVTKEELLRAIWGDCYIGDAVVKTTIAQVRLALGDTADAPGYIETISRLGYRFIASVGASNLPVTLTSFVGRKRELAEVKRRLADARLVTLVGPAGVGKTRLAIRAAGDLAAATPHGIWWVDLGSVFDAGFVGQAVAHALNLREDSHHSPTATVVLENLIRRLTAPKQEGSERVAVDLRC